MQKCQTWIPTETRTSTRRWAGTLACVLAATLLAPTGPARASDAIEEAGDILQILLPAGGAAGAIATQDWEGLGQLGASYATSIGSTLILKEATSKRRPDGESASSFPSGHAASAFAGAAFINRRWGPWFGVPAYAAATFVGFSRIHADKHFLDDVVAGASIALLSNWAWVSPLPSRLAVAPAVVGSGYGVGVSMPLGGGGAQPKRGSLEADAPLYRSVGKLFGAGDGPTETPRDDDPYYRPRYRFEFDLGAVFQERNAVRAPRSTGSRLDLASFGGTSSASAAGRFEFFLTDEHEVELALLPYGVREEDSFARPVRFAGRRFIRFTPINARTVFNDYRATYRYRIGEGSRVSGTIGAALSLQETETKLDGLISNAAVRRWTLFPLLHAGLDFGLAPPVRLSFEANGMTLGSDYTGDASVRLRYQLARHWDVGIGWRIFGRGMDHTDQRSELWAHMPFMSFGYRWGQRGS